jgi:hypothetical protein
MFGNLNWVTRIARRSAVGKRWTMVLCTGVLVGSLTIVGFGLTVTPAFAASTSTVDLGQASTYAVLSGASVANTVSADGAPYTTLRGDLGVMADVQPTGFPPGVVTGSTRVGTSVTQAYADLGAAYSDVAGRTGGTAIAGDLAGTTFAPGLYSAAAAVADTGKVTLDGGGNPNAVFVFKIDAALNVAAGAQIVLSNGAQASNVFWQVNGAAAVGAGAKFTGTLMASAAIAIGAGTKVNGRALALNGAISLNDDDFYSAPPVIAIAGGATATTNNMSPTITGTTDIVAPGVVNVTVAGQALSAVPVDGTWAVASPTLANGTYPVRASVVDGAGNASSATQELTVDTVLPIVTIGGGASVITNDPTRSISGASDIAPGSTVTVKVGSQTLTALVQPSGSWNVAPDALSDGTYAVGASVTDLAGNDGTTSQVLHVDTVAAAVTISGGDHALTNHASPTISGTAAVAPGTTVTVTLANQTLTGLVQRGRTWSVKPAFLSDGPHRVVMSVVDAAGNAASVTQTLTVDTVAPLVTIAGGRTANATGDQPTIRGTSNATPGTTVTVTIAGQTMTTLLQPNGTWNVSPTSLCRGTLGLVATVMDPAGNVGRATQTLTVTRGTSVCLSLRVSAPSYTGHAGTGVRIRFVLSRSANVTLTVLHGKTVVASLSTGLLRPGGSWLIWNGEIKHTLAPKGLYRFIIRAVSPDDAVASKTGTVHII